MADYEHFADNIQYEEAVAAIKGCDEFFEKEEEGVLVFNYKYCTKRTFPDPRKATSKEEERLLKIRRECRGLMFDSETKKVIARRYHKFFNIGELEETHEAQVDLTKKHSILVKYDGSLVSPVLASGKLRFASKGGFGRISQLLEERFFTRTDIPYTDFCMYWINKNYTPLFEFCSPRVKIVLQYEEDLLMLTSIRDNITGKYLPYSELQESAIKYNIPYASQFTGSINQLPEFLTITKSTSNIEGFVIQFEDGSFFKVKTEWYFARTKKDKQEFSLNSERSIWSLIINQEIDDALAQCNDTHLKECIRKFEDMFWTELESATSSIYNFMVKNAHISDRKEYLDLVRDSGLSHSHQNILLKLDSTKTKMDVKDNIISCLKQNCSSKKFNSICKPLLNNITFKE